jgi:hypothetical protein
MKRSAELDAARGMMLVWMVLVHLPTVLSNRVNQPFGYVSSSEGFIFLSAFLTGRIYFRIFERDGAAAMNRKLVLRAVRLYVFHILLLLFAFVAVSRYALRGRPALHNMLDFYFLAGVERAVRDGLLLIYRPPLLDIIPLYVGFCLLTPLLIWFGSRISWRLVLGGSGAIWLAAQFGFRTALYHWVVAATPLRVPLNEMGAFNPWAWQFLWVLGMYFGVRWAKDELPVTKWAQRFWIPAACVALALFALRYSEVYGLNLGSYSVLFDKWNLATVRLIDFPAVILIVLRFHAVLRRIALQRFLEPISRSLITLGQASLQVFCAHFFFCFIALGLVGNAALLPGWLQFVVATITFAFLLLLAKASQLRRDPYARPQLVTLPWGFAHSHPVKIPR